jgi:hypothetical protein
MIGDLFMAILLVLALPAVLIAVGAPLALLVWVVLAVISRA